MAFDPAGKFTNLSSRDLFHLNHATSGEQSPLPVYAFPLVKLGVIFWDNLNKMKDNLCQECVKGGGGGGLLSLQGKFEAIVPDFHGKITVFFSSFDPTFHQYLPKISLSHPHKNYIFEISYYRAIL